MSRAKRRVVLRRRRCCQRRIFFAAFESDTRADLDGTSVVWNSDDLLTIFTKTSHNRKYPITNLKDDRRSATFSYVGFTGTDGTKISENYAVYPYDANATLSNGIITTTLSALQTYNPAGQLSYALMSAKSADNNFSFKNAGSLVRVKINKNVPDDYMLRSITLSSAIQKIAGEVTIDLNQTDQKAVVASNGVNEITLQGINTSIDLEAQAFYIAVPAQNFEDDSLVLTLNLEEGTKSFTLPALEFKLGKIKTIACTLSDAEDFTGNTPSTEDDSVSVSTKN